MISDDAYELIGILLGAAMNSAADDKRPEFYERCSQARYEFITMMDREKIPAENADQALVDEAIRRHAVVMLTHMRREHIPRPGDLHPTYHQTMAAWHLARVTALRAAPAELAAKILREEALTALDTTTKETPA